MSPRKTRLNFKDGPSREEGKSNFVDLSKISCEINKSKNKPLPVSKEFMSMLTRLVNAKNGGVPPSKDFAVKLKQSQLESILPSSMVNQLKLSTPNHSKPKIVTLRETSHKLSVKHEGFILSSQDSSKKEVRVKKGQLLPETAPSIPVTPSSTRVGSTINVGASTIILKNPKETTKLASLNSHTTGFLDSNIEEICLTLSPTPEDTNEPDSSSSLQQTTNSDGLSKQSSVVKITNSPDEKEKTLDAQIIRKVVDLLDVENHGGIPPKVLVKFRPRANAPSSASTSLTIVNSPNSNVVKINYGPSTSSSEHSFSPAVNTAELTSSIAEVPTSIKNCDDPHSKSLTSACVIEELIKRQFTSTMWTLEERQKLVQTGRPRPRRMDSNQNCFENIKWLTGCRRLNEFFCWPCLLFNKKKTWSLLNGVNVHTVSRAGKASRFESSVANHENTEDHMKASSSIDTWELLYEPTENKNVKRSRSAVEETDSPPINSAAPLDEENISAKTKDICIIRKLISNRFTSEKWTDGERLQLVSKKKAPSKETTAGKSWLVRSIQLDRWFCWPCLLFADQHFSYHFKQILTIDTVLNEHELSMNHMTAFLQLKQWENKANEKFKHQRLAKECMNAYVKRNWVIFTQLIDLICLEEKRKDNLSLCTDTLVEKLRLLSRYDWKLKKCVDERVWDYGKSFLGTFVSTQKFCLLTSIELFLHRKIKEELSTVPFVSVLLTDTSKIVDKSWISVILRYVDDRGNVNERFVKFIEVGLDRSSTFIFNQLKPILNDFGCHKKVVSFTFDGCVVAPYEIVNFNNAMRNEYPPAKYFPSRGHNWKLIMLQTLSHLRCCRVFFLRVSELLNFMRKTSFLRNVVIDDETEILWDIPAGFLAVLINHHGSIVRRLELIGRMTGQEVSSHSALNAFDNEEMISAVTFHQFLTNFHCCFLLLLLDKIFTSLNMLAATFEKSYDLNVWNLEAMTTYQNLIQVKLKDFAKLFKASLLMTGESAEDDDDGDTTNKDENERLCRKSFHLIVDTALLLVMNKIKHFDVWTFIDAAVREGRIYPDPEGKLQAYCVRLSKNFPMFVPDRLIAQLTFLYDNPFFFGRSPSDIMNHIRGWNLFELMEVHAFLRLCITLPIDSAQSKTSPAVQRMSTYVEGKKELNSTHALIWMEKDLLDDLQNSALFHSIVLNNVDWTKM